MTNEEFKKCQDKKLEMSGRELAKRLGVTPSSISHWREDREVPPYIVKLLEFLCAEKDQKLLLPLSLDQLFGLSRAADRRGLTVQDLLLEVIRGLAEEPISSPLKTVNYATDLPDGTPAQEPLKVASTIAHYIVAPPAVPPIAEN